MKNFLYKEFKLCLSPINYLFLAFTAMICIPSYPCYVSFFYICLSVFFIFNNSELNKDIAYSMILPIKKRDIVKSRCIIVAVYETVAFLFTMLIAFTFVRLSGIENLAGIEANFAFFGLVLIPVSIFNLILFSNYYKKAEKPGFPFLFGSIAYWLIYGILEFPIWTKNNFNIPFFLMLDKSDSASLIMQLPIFFAGIIIFVAGWFLTYKISAKNFEKVDL